VAVAQGQLDPYLDLCADIGLDRVECGEGFTEHNLDAQRVVQQARSRDLGVEFEMGKKHGGPFTADDVSHSIEQGKAWLNAGAEMLVIEARESARGVGLFDESGWFQPEFADRFAEAFGLEILKFEAPTKPSQFALLDHFGPEVHLSNVRLEEILRVEIYRRGLHSDAFAKGKLRPPGGARADGLDEVAG
jgi:phosphosulfolactate synthase